MEMQYNQFRIRQKEKVLDGAWKNSKDNERHHVIYDSYQKGRKRKILENIVTNSIRPTKNHLIYLNTSQEFNTYLIAQDEVKITEIVNKSQWTASKYFLYQFNRNSQVCILQRNPPLKKTRISYFKFLINQGNVAFEELSSAKEVEEGIHDQDKTIFEVNNQGRLGWYQNQQGNLQISLYQRDEKIKKYSVNLKEFHQIFTQAEFKILSMWQNDNLLFLAINPVNEVSSLSSNSPFSPIIIVNIENEGKCPISFSSCKFNKIYQLSFKKCINLQDYCVFFPDDGTKNTKMPYYVYSKERQLIVIQDYYNPSQWLDKVYKHNTIVFYYRDQDSIRCVEKQYYKLHSLSFQKSLELLQNAQSLKETTKKAIIIFGGDKTGKSTLRHFLSGQKMIYSFNEDQGFSEVVAENDELKGLEHDDQRDKISWMNFNKDTAIIDIPDWNQRDSLFRVELFVLLSRLFKIYKEFHFVITIPTEYIEESQQNQEFFQSVLDLVGREQGIEQYITLVLTKVDSREESLPIFTEKIEQISQINSQTGDLIRKIAEQNRILSFQNRWLDQDQGTQMLQDILKSNFISFIQRQNTPVQQYIQQPNQQTNLILQESQYYIRLLNTYLLDISHSINSNHFGYAQKIISSHILNYYKQEYIKKERQEKQKIAEAFIVVLAKLNFILTKQKQTNLNSVNQLKSALIHLNSLLQDKEYHFQSVGLSFVAVMRNSLVLPLEHTMGRKIHPLADFTKILINQSDGILGKNIKHIIKYLQEFESVRNSQAIKEFPVPSSTKSKTKRKKINRVEMSYEQQKKQFLQKSGEILQKICSLPSNALKLDLIFEQLNKYCGKSKLQSKDYKEINFYLRQGSKICQFHQLYYEAIILLVVIPDFSGIEILIDDFMQFLKRNYSYESKKMLNKVEGELIQKILTIARQCLRDNLIKKLINLQSLSGQTFLKPTALRQSQLKSMKNYLSNPQSIKNYKQRLQSKDIHFFYNLKDTEFQQLLAQKGEIIMKCQQNENQETTKKKYQVKEALRYILDGIPLPNS